MSQIANAAIIIRDSFQQWLNDEMEGGIAVVVSNLKDMWEQAQEASNKVRVFVCYMGEDIRGPFADRAVAGRVDRKWTLAIIRGRGYASKRGSTLTDQQPTTSPFYEVLESARDHLRNMEGISAEYPVEFRSVKPMQLGNLVMDGYLIEFSTANDLPKLTVKGT